VLNHNFPCIINPFKVKKVTNRQKNEDGDAALKKRAPDNIKRIMKTYLLS
jgi:hypothetical protein